ncbi:hypothetical protein ACFV4P_28140 [Kitasatospora sp. NPDC059795]|uniref:hypothetical protein n=1 Tax=Kitasatospora sp. NPDC059795 TaxID=3346949 RepID=UPI00365D36E9
MINEYHPAFTHQDWIDNEDRVQAGGEKGLNIRFHNLEAEFRTIADDHLNPVIDKIAGKQTVLSLVPVLAPNTSPPAAWVLNNDFAQKPDTVAEAHGIMSVVLPGGAAIVSMTVFGSVRPADPTKPVPLPGVHLRSNDMASTGAVPIIDFKAFGEPAQPVTPTTVKNSANKYFVEADATSGGNTGAVTLNCIQIVCQ